MQKLHPALTRAAQRFGHVASIRHANNAATLAALAEACRHAYARPHLEGDARGVCRTSNWRVPSDAARRESESAGRVFRDGLRAARELTAPVAEIRDVKPHSSRTSRWMPGKSLY